MKAESAAISFQRPREYTPRAAILCRYSLIPSKMLDCSRGTTLP